MITLETLFYVAMGSNPQDNSALEAHNIAAATENSENETETKKCRDHPTVKNLEDQTSMADKEECSLY